MPQQNMATNAASQQGSQRQEHPNAYIDVNQTYRNALR